MRHFSSSLVTPTPENFYYFKLILYLKCFYDYLTYYYYFDAY